jgi:hypothetical protein
MKERLTLGRHTIAVAIPVLCALVIGGTLLGWWLFADEGEIHTKNEARCRKNLRILTLALKSVLADKRLKDDFFKAVAEGEDPLIWVARANEIEPWALVCPEDVKRRDQAWVRGDALPKELGSQDISYETWPWTAELWDHLGLDYPIVWEKEGFHEGKRMVETSFFRTPLMNEEDFQEAMRDARKKAGLPEEP